MPREDMTPIERERKSKGRSGKVRGSGEKREPPQRCHRREAMLCTCFCSIRLLPRGKPPKKPEIGGMGQCFSKWVPLTTCLSISQALVENTDYKQNKKFKKIHTDSWVPQISRSRISRTLKFAFLTTTCILKFKNHHHGVLHQRRPQFLASCFSLLAGFPPSSK